MLTDKQFTGHQREGELYYMKARFYDPTVGRFLQPDSIVPDPMNPQALNRYSYVLNNPMGYTDPTGYCGVSSWGDFGDCFTEGASATSHFVTGATRRWGYWGWGRASWGAERVQNALLWSWGAAAEPAQTAWSSGPVEAVREYVADKSQDVGVMAVATMRDPGTAPQNAVALGFSLVTVGDRRGSYNGLVAYENAWGPARWFFLDKLGNRAITPGNITFAKDTFDPELYWHEYRHFEQSGFLGPHYLVVYIGVNALVFGSEDLHPMEVDADRAGVRNQRRSLPWK